MFDLKIIRNDPEVFDFALARRGVEPQSSTILKLDADLRAVMTENQEAQARRNKASKEIGAAKGRGEDATELFKEVATLKDKLQVGEERARDLNRDLKALLMGIPNLPDASTPDGKDEDENVFVRDFGTPPKFSYTPKEHFDLGEALGMMDFEAGAKLSGARFVVLKGPLARLERALGQFMLDLHTGEHDYLEVQTPTLVKAPALLGTGQLPKFEEDLFKTTNDYYLIPTAEVTLTNLGAGDILEEESLPQRFIALTQCFRSEAGSAGRDTRGMIRQHQFNKVEMVSVVKPEDSKAELERMTGCAETVLKKLGIPYKVIELCTGDIGFGAHKTYDIEVWLPGQDRYREISSCSNCGDFQARRMNMRSRPKGGKETRFVHTLNGSGLAVGRTLVALMENYQKEDGSIEVPEVLQGYMAGQKVISI
jgi:seryl-tRNA synthetase